MSAGIFLGVPLYPLHAQSSAQNTRVTRQLEAVLRARIQRPDGKPVALSLVPTSRSDRGEFARIKLQAAPARIGDLYVQEIALDARDVTVDVPSLFAPRKKRVRTQRARTTLRAVISENDLTRMLAEGRSTADMGLRVRFLPGNRMRVTGNLNYPLLKGPVEGTGHFKLAAGSKVNLVIESLKLRGLEVPTLLKERFAQSINPIIDYQDLPFNPPFKSFRIVGDKAYLSTSA